MAENRTPTRRNDVIRCQNCGEDYSVTYKRCPFCDEMQMTRRNSGRSSSRGGSSRSSGYRSIDPYDDRRDDLDDTRHSSRRDVRYDDQYDEDYDDQYDEEDNTYTGRRSGASRPSGGKRLAPSTRSSRSGGGYGNYGDFNLLRIIGIVVPLVLIVAAAYIVITVLGPMISAGRGENPDASGSPGIESPLPSDSSSPEPSASGSSDPQVSEPVVVTPVPSGVTAITLDKSDFTLTSNESYRIRATLTPADASDTVTWSVDNPDVLRVAQDGTVTNTNTTNSKVTVTVTASCGDVSATCLVRCNPGSTADPQPSSTGGSSSGGTVNTGSAVISNAGDGLRVRSGPGTSYDILASLTNGNQVTVVESAGDGWYKITFDGTGGTKVTGYVLGEYLTNQ